MRYNSERPVEDFVKRFLLHARRSAVIAGGALGCFLLASPAPHRYLICFGLLGIANAIGFILSFRRDPQAVLRVNWAVFRINIGFYWFSTMTLLIAHHGKQNLFHFLQGMLAHITAFCLPAALFRKRILQYICGRIAKNPALAVVYNNRGNGKQVKGDLEGAIADFERAIELDPKYAIAYNNRGNVKQHKADLEGAIADYSRAIELDAKYAIAYRNRGNAKQAVGDVKGAVEDWKRACELDPKLGPTP